MQNKNLENLIQEFKTNQAFRHSILTLQNSNDRIAKSIELGFDFQQEDLQDLEVMGTKNKDYNNNLAEAWSCKGPCHDKCA